MNMKRIIAVFLVAYLIIFITLLLLIGKTPEINFNVPDANDVVKAVSEKWNDVASGNSPGIETDLQYAVFDSGGRSVYATGDGLAENISDAIFNRYIIIDVIKDNVIVGKVGFYNDIETLLQKSRERLIFGAVFLLIIFAGGCAVYTLYIYRKVISPFNKMQNFAQHIASGNLEIPLEMDRSNLFGAFTESFDIMREELHRARENERAAERSKKELVASLSHDIKTPVATIKATTEVMQAETKDDRNKELLTVIESRTEQIDSLITNMFHATLEELQELKVTPAETASTTVYDMILSADYNKKIKSFSLPQCILLSDPIRLSQIFDNIIGNSYKYAGTDIEITSSFDEEFLIIQMRDFGSGVPEEDLPMIFNKYYRGTNSKEKSGYGLGLYISKYLMNQMNGDIIGENSPNGFSITILLKLAH